MQTSILMSQKALITKNCSIVFFFISNGWNCWIQQKLKPQSCVKTYCNSVHLYHHHNQILHHTSSGEGCNAFHSHTETLSTHKKHLTQTKKEAYYVKYTLIIYSTNVEKQMSIIALSIRVQIVKNSAVASVNSKQSFLL